MANIEYRNLGNSGLRVSTIGLGCNNFVFNIYEDNGIMESRNLIDEKQDVYVAILKGIEDMDNPGKYIALGK